METKVCRVCGKELPITEYWKSSKAKDGLESRCKTCLKEKNKKLYYEHQQERRESVKRWHEEHKEHDKLKNKLYREKHREELNEKKKAYRKDNAKKVKMYADAHREEQKAYRDIHKSELKEYQKNYRENNKEKIREYYKTKRKTDIQYKLKCNYLRSISRIIKTQKVSPKQEELIGCDFATFKNHIESLFSGGMNWNNYGINGWCIDHITPISSFDLTDIEQVKMCFNYKNTQPLWAKDNIKKGDLLCKNFNGKEVKAGQIFVK